MKYRKVWALLLALVLLCALCACGSKTAAAESAAETSAEAPVAGETAGITVTDQLGREVKLSGPAERLVAIEAADCEIIYALGCGDRLVGRGEYCDWPAEVAEVTAVQSGYETNLEQIIALEPDVVVMNTMNQTEEEVKALEAAGIAVVSSASTDIQGVYTNIAVLGTVLGKEAEAAALTDGMKSTFEALSANAAENEGKTVYFEVSPLEWGLWTAGTGTFMDEVANILGLTNAFADVEGWAEISEEQVLERSPDYIVTISMYYGEGPTPVEEILSRTGWEQVTAVRNNAVLNLQNNELSRPSYRLAEGAQMLADFVAGVLEAAA